MPLRAGGCDDGRWPPPPSSTTRPASAVARYDKIHLFDVDIPGKAEQYRESAHVAPGSKTVVVDTPVGKLGLSVCYDIRFPELFRRLSAAGAQILTVPVRFHGSDGPGPLGNPAVRSRHRKPVLRHRAGAVRISIPMAAKPTATA